MRSMRREMSRDRAHEHDLDTDSAQGVCLSLSCPSLAGLRLKCWSSVRMD